MKDPLTELAAALGDKPALIDDGPGRPFRRWSFDELEANANRLGRVFLDHGVRPRDKVIWCGHNSPWAVAAIHAARKIAAVAVPLNYRLAAEEAAYVVENSDAVLAFADAEYAPLFERIRNEIPQVRHVLIFDGEAHRGQIEALPLIDTAASGELVTNAEPGEAGTMIYTSGTTGQPKGAVRATTGDPDQRARMVEYIGYRADDVYLTTGPLYHSGPSGFMGISQLLGNTVILQRKFEPEDWLRLVDEYRVTTTFSAPTPIRMVCNLPQGILDKYNASSMRILIGNAAPWSYALKLSYMAQFGESSLFEVYGSTELGVNTILRPEHQRRKKGSCGKPAPGVELRLFDAEGKVVDEPYTEGELYVRSPSVFITYHKAQDKYDEEHLGDWHTVGDIAYFDDEGFYYICDRKKDMIISGGVNIYPAEIEAALELHPEIQDVAVFGIPSDQWGEQVHAIVVPLDGADLDSDAVIAYAREHLASYKVPRSVDFMDEIPRTGTGKILKRQLRAPYWEGRQSRVV